MPIDGRGVWFASIIRAFDGRRDGVGVNPVGHRLDVRLLGQIAVEVDGSDCNITSGRQKAILALLASESGQVVSVDRIVDTVWGETPPPSATNALQVHVSALRKALGPAGVAVETRSPGYVLETTRPDVQVAVDALDFEQLARTKLASGDGPTWDSIASLWTGTPFGSMLDAPFAGLFGERLSELYRGVLEARCDDQLARGMHEQLVPDMQSYVEAEPYRERRWRQWVLALYRCGRQSEALATFQRARQRLIDDLGIEPGPALAALEYAVLAQDAALELLPLTLSGSPVPRPSTPTIGRDDDIERVAARLAPDGDARIVTLTGPGGVGKTRLAQEVARRLAIDYRGRIAFCDLSDIIEAELVLPELARIAGISAGADPVDAIVAATTVPALIVVDNAEQVTAGALRLAEVTQRSECRFLITSRVALRLSGEHVVAVSPLGVGFAAALFRQRVEAVAPGQYVDDGTARKLAEAVDGLALAIELAAALARVMSPDDIVRELSTATSGLEALSGGSNDLPARHRSLTAAMAWGIQLLSDRARSLLGCLGSFATAFGLHDVVWLAPADFSRDEAAVRELLTELVDSSLVFRQGSALTMLTTVRAYVRSLTSLEEQRALADRHAEWVRHVVDDIGARLEAGIDEAAAMTEFAERLPDLRAAFRHLQSCGRTDDAVRIILGTRSCWVQQGSLAEALRSLNEIDDDTVGSGERQVLTPLIRFQAMAFRGLLAKAMGDRRTGVPLLERAAVDLRRVAPASIDLLNTLCHLAADRAETGDHESAAALADEAVAVAEATGASGTVAMAWDLTGYVAGLAGHRDLAVAAARHAVETERERPTLQLPHALSALAEALAAAGQTEEAAAIARQAVEQAKLFAVAPTLVAEVDRRVSAALASVDPAAAAKQLASAAASYAAVGMEESLAESLLGLAGLVERVDPIAAARLLGASAGPRYLEGPRRTDIEAHVEARIGRAAYNAEHLAGSLLDPDATSRLAADAARSMADQRQLPTGSSPNLDRYDLA